MTIKFTFIVLRTELYSLQSPTETTSILTPPLYKGPIDFYTRLHDLISKITPAIIVTVIGVE